MGSKGLSLRHVHILVVLADEPLHGYAISQEIEDRTEGRVVLRPGSLYRALHQLVEKGCIEEVADDCDERRRTYRLTAEGRQALAAELAEMSELVRDGRRAGVLSPGAGG